MITAKIRNRLLRSYLIRKFYFKILDYIRFINIKLSKKDILKELVNSNSNIEKFDILSNVLLSHQRKIEFSKFIESINDEKIHVIVEIGTADSGTHLLLSELINSSKTMVAIDLELRNRKTLSAINSNHDKRFGIEGSSQSKETFLQLSQLLNNRKIDLLFIDGDHSYEGVRNDFETYKDIVNQNGIIAFHDIVPDSFSRTGYKTSSYVGEVPKYWNEIKHDYRYQEFIESKDQDGCGIGIIYFDQT